MEITEHGEEKNPAQGYSRENPGKQQQLRKDGREVKHRQSKS